jgi:hypothetical protein
MTAPARRVDRRGRLPARVAVALLAAMLAACGGTATPSGSGDTPELPASASATPGVSGQPQPSPTRWAGDVIEAVVKLGVLDLQMESAADDLGAAAADQDLKAMYRVADRYVSLLGDMQFQADRIKDEPATAEAARAYQAAIPGALAGATQLRDSISASDADGVLAGSERLASALDAYADARRLIGPLVEQALQMQRQILK